MTMRSLRTCGTALVLWAAAAAFPLIAQTESDPAPMIRVSVVEAKLDMIAEFEHLQQQWNEALEKEGFPYRHVWTASPAGTTREYHIVTPLNNYAELDDWPYTLSKVMGEGPAAAWLARFAKCVDRRRVVILEQIDEASIPAKAGRERKLAVLSYVKTAPGSRSGYEEHLKTGIVPVIRKAGGEGLYVYRVRYGGSTGEIVIARMLDKFGQLDQPGLLRKELGEEKARELFQKGGRFIANHERILLRYHDDLSFTSRQEVSEVRTTPAQTN